MRFPDATPRSPRSAVLQHVWLRRIMATLAITLFTLAAAACVVLAFLLADRWVEWPASWRAAGPRVALAATAAGAVWLVGWWCIYRPSSARVAAQLDHAVPGNQDRWATAIDLAARQAQGETVGAPALVERLLSQSSAPVPWRLIWPTVPRRALALATIAFLAVGAIAALIVVSGVFNLPLLWQRFLDPHGNYPRDSFTRIALVSANGAPFTGAIAPIPEGAALELVIDVDHSRQWFASSRAAPPESTTRPSSASDDDHEPPVLEVMTADGVQQRSLARREGRWVYAQPRLATPLRFRIRAGDGLTQFFEQVTIRRIRIDSVHFTASLPKYTRAALPPRQTLTARRLALLVDARVEFEVACDAPLAEFEAAFEVVQRSEEKKALTSLSRQDLLSITKGPARAPIGPKRRIIPWQRVDERTARFRMNIEETGILRLRSTGANGIAGDDLLCLIEAVPDTPPKIVVSGVEQDTTIIPGETVAVQYRVEDDWAVTDLVMQWKSGGVVATEDWVGEDVIRSPDIGKRVVAGQELVQRMKYPVLEARPLELQITATDSKGQEATSGKFRIHIFDEDYAVRVERGVKRLESLEAIAASYRQRMMTLDNQLNVVMASAGEAKTWPEDKLPVLEKYLAAVGSTGGPAIGSDLAPSRFNATPARIDRTLITLLACARLTPAGAELLPTAKELQSSNDLRAAADRLRERLRAAARISDLWRDAVGAERARFVNEWLLHRALKLDQRIEALLAAQGNAAYFKANAPFYIKQAGELLTATRQQQERLPSPALAPLLDELSAAVRADALPAIAPVMRRLAAALRSEHRATPQATRDLLAELRRPTAGETARTAMIAGDLASMLGQSEQFAAGATLSATMAHWTPAQASDPLAAIAETDAMDLMLIVEQLRAEIVGLRAANWAGRYSGSPSAKAEREAELRELVLWVGDASLAAASLNDEARARLTDVAIRLAGDPLSDLLQEPAASDALLAELAAVSRGLLPAALTSAERMVATAGPAIASRAGEVAARMRQHADAVAALAKQAGRTAASDAIDGPRLAVEARALAREVDAIEAAWRAVTQAQAVARLLRSGGASDGWNVWEPWVGSGVLVAGVVFRCEQELIDGHFGKVKDSAKWPALLAETEKSARAIGDELASAGAAMAMALRGQGGSVDFAAATERLGARGHVAWAQQTLAALPTLTGPADGAARADLRERVTAGALGAVARGERWQAWLVRVRATAWGAATRPSAQPSAWLTDLEGLAATGGPGGESDLREAAQAAKLIFARTGAATAARDDAAPRRQAALDQALDTAIGRQSANLQLAPIRSSRLGARLHTSTAMSIAQHQRRVATLAREAELSLQREMLERLLPAPPVEWSQRDTAGTSTAPSPRHAEAIGASTPHDRLPLAAMVARSLELRGRGLVFERRLNRGVDVTGGEEPVLLALPRHIVDELLRARNRKSPEDFKSRIEAYYADLQKDFSR